MKSKKELFPKAICELDGQEIELIVHILEEKILGAATPSEIQNAKKIEWIIKKLLDSKKTFHSDWREHLLQRFNTKEKELI